MVKLACMLTAVLAASCAAAQSPAPSPETGSVSGHVVLGDSHLPARMAEIMLLEVPGENSDKSASDLATGMAETGMDGSFTIPHVPPGAYYIFAEKSGYVIPVSMDFIGIDKNNQPASKDLRDALAAGLSPITVAANRVTTVELVLHRGAAISGVIRFDDGAPAADITVSLLQKDKSGKWTTPPNIGDMNHQADDQGNFRLAGLPAGEYLLKATLESEAPLVKDSDNERSHYQWDVYFGDGIRPRDAKSITLKDGEESNGDNITIPLSRMHSVSGSVISLESGSPVGSARVELHNRDDDALASETSVNSTDGQFRLPFVAEGEYNLEVTHAADFAPGPTDGQKPIRTYADSSQPLIVKGETSVTIQLKPQPPVAPALPAAQ